MDSDTDTLTIPHELYVRISSYASSRGETPESLVAAWLRERLSSDKAAQVGPTEIQARIAALSALDGIVSAPVSREWADQHDSAVAEAGGEDMAKDGNTQ
jgi:hypothetical protein